MNYSGLLDYTLLNTLAERARAVGAATDAQREEVLRTLEALFPHLPTDLLVLRRVSRLGIPDALAGIETQELPLEEFHSLAEEARSQLFFSEEMAEVAVLAWAQALGMRPGPGVPRRLPAPDILEALAPPAPHADFGAAAFGPPPASGQANVSVEPDNEDDEENEDDEDEDEENVPDPHFVQPPRTKLAPPKPAAPKPAPPSKWVLPPDFILTPEIKETFDYVENGSGHLLLTGKAGTGKSTWLHFFALHTQKNFVVLAPTGIAAVNVGGATLHSFFGFPPRPLLPNDRDIKRFGPTHPRYDIIRQTDVIIIDEISMVRADMLDAVDYSLRINMKTDLPFGGKQVVFIGDVFQLPPVVSGNHELERQLYPNLFPEDNSPPGYLFADDDGAYATPYFFSARVFRKSPISYQVLKEIFRQRDAEFITLLNRVRHGQPRQEDINALNSRLIPGYSPPPDRLAVTLVTTNAIAKQLNDAALAALPGTVQRYKAEREGTFDAKWQPADDPLELKPGAQVLFTRNHPDGLWVNGTLGVVEKLTEETISIRTRNGAIMDVERTTWEHADYSWNPEKRLVETVVKGTFTQFPLRLAWALTIHKSQGMTFDEVVLDLGSGAFAHGQLYVALSRCRTFEGLTLRQPVRYADVKVDPVVLDFVRNLPR